MEKIDFSFIITKEDFSKLKTAPEVQLALNKFNNLYDEVMKEVYDYVEKHTRLDKEQKEAAATIKEMTARITDMKRNVENTAEDFLKQEYTEQLGELERKLEKAEAHLEDIDFPEQMVLKMKFQANQLKAEGIDHLAEELGNWFEEGHAGPGTVKYKDLTFTAQ